MKRKFVAYLSAVLCAAVGVAQTNPLEDYVLALHDKVETESRYCGTFDPAQAYSLPVGMVREVGSTRYIICIDSAWFTPQGAFFNAYMALEFPGSAKKLAFAARNVRFNPQGVMPGPMTRLVLVSEQKIAIGPNIHLLFPSDGSNYVEWNCNGFEAVNLKGKFEFNPAIIQPDPALSNAERVTASLEIHTGDVHNIIVQTNITPFIVKGIKDVGFSVTGATVDLSETTDIAGMVFPPGYANPSLTLPGSFTGFYLRNLTVRLPEELNKGNNQPSTLQAVDMILDQTGITGTFLANNVITIQQGSMSGWGFSVNQIGVTLANNHLNGGQMKGQVSLPIAEGTGLNYEAIVKENPFTQQLDYAFTMSPAENITASVMSAQLTVFNTSIIRIEKTNGHLLPLAELNGELAFQHGNLTTGKLAFQKLQMGTVRPYFYSGTFGFGNGNHTAGNFPIVLSDVKLIVSQTNPGISLKASINFMEQQDQGFSASGSFAVYARIEEEEMVAVGENGDSYKTHWSFDKVKISDIDLYSNTSAFALKGKISFRDNDPVYGKGFYGQIGLTIKKPEPAKEMAFSAWFGRVNGYRYFYVDGKFDAKISLGQIDILTLYGGLYYHMRNSRTPEQMMVMQHGSLFNASQLYVPDSNIGVGFKAGATLGYAPSSAALNADALFEVVFNSAQSGGGMNSISFNGNVFLMTTVAERKSKPLTDNKMYGSFTMSYDFNNRSFHALAGTYINYHPVSAFGQCEIHFDPQVWYVYFGKPSQRVNVGISGLANLSAYCMLGQIMEPMPPVPSNVAQVVGNYGLDHGRNQNDLATGKGIAIGASLGLGFSGAFGWDDKFEVYYGISAGAGFDLMIANYGPNAHCAGSSQMAGINGWYATGQIYAYLTGNVGVRGHIKFTPGCDKLCLIDSDFDFSILSLSAAAVLEARLPKPYYVAGAVGVSYDILGVLNGNINCHFELGHSCSPVNQ